MHIGALPQGLHVFAVGAPGRDGGELHIRHQLGQGEEDRNALDGAGVHEGDELVIETAEDGVRAGIEERNGNVNGIDAAPLSHVVRDILADSHDAVDAPQHFRLGGARKGAIGAEGESQRGTRQVDDPGLTRPERGFELELRRVIGGGQDDRRREFHDLAREVGADVGMIGSDVDFHFAVAECHYARARGKNGRGPGSQIGEEARVLIGAEARQARNHAADVTLARKSLH